ncbi:MAG: hypothetical protein ACKVPX_15175 [Myxococcaceae bacterium]
MLAWLAGLAAALLATGCSPSYVEGSLSRIMDLGFEKVWVSSNPDEVVVRFAKPLGDGEDTVFQLTVRLEGVALFSNIQFDLAEILPSGSQRGEVTRNVLDDTRRRFPPILVGTLLLWDVPLEPFQRVSGRFDVRFENGIEFASGHTAFATFQGTVP